MKDVVISLCDRTGNMVRPWAEAGYECFCVDIQHSIRRDRSETVGRGLVHFVWGDCRSWRMPATALNRVAIGFGFTPCTHLSSSGARDHKKKAGWMLADAIQLFDSAEVAFSFGGFPYMMENPVGRLSTHRRKPDYTFQPWQYGDLWFKKTCLWTGGGLQNANADPLIAAGRNHGKDLAYAAGRRPSRRKIRNPAGICKGRFSGKRRVATCRNP